MVDAVASNFCQTMQNFAINEEINVEWKNLVALVSLAYGIPLLILNLWLSLVLFLKRKQDEFSSPFYSLFIITTILESFWWVFSQLADRIANATLIAEFFYSRIPERHFSNTIIFFGMHYFMHGVMIITACLSLNRLITLISYNDAHQWKKVLRLIIVFTIPLIFTWQLLFNTVVKCRIVNVNGNNEIYYIILKNDEFNYGVTLSLGNLVVDFTCAFIGLILNAITIIYLLVKRTKLTSRVKKSKRRPVFRSSELKLFILSLFMFTNQMVVGIIQLIFFINTFNPNPHADKLHETYRFTKDIMCLTPSIFLILMSTPVRKELFRIPGGKGTSVVPIGTTRARSAVSVRSFQAFDDNLPSVAEQVKNPAIVVTSA